jgi:diguanylate cyclase (GGDEF)-like protein
VNAPENFAHLLRWTIATAALLAAISIVDLATGADVAFSLFYLFAVALIAWKTAHYGLSLATAAVSAVVWLVAERYALGAPSTAVLLWNAATRTVILVAAAIVICRLRRALRIERSLARTDFLTQTLNARAFGERAALEIARARRNATPLTVSFIDLDNFKSVNDTLGHSQGDVVLRIVADTLRARLRESDCVARLGGDEFVVLLAETGLGQAGDVMSKLERHLAEAMQARAWPVTFSIGAAVFESPPEDVDMLLRCADSTMYRAKTGGKNSVKVHLFAAEIAADAA